MYFNFIPAIKYDTKPISYPFSESDYVVAKNFFKRYRLSDGSFSSAVFFKQYAVNDDYRIEQIAETVYGDPEYDWVIALVNNMMNPIYDLPMSENDLRKHIESSYDNPYYDIHHYEIISDEEQTEEFGKVLMPGGTWVDETFYNSEIKLVNDIFPDLNPSSENILITKNFVFDDPEKSPIIAESQYAYYADTSLPFVPVLREDGFRSSTQLVLGNAQFTTDTQYAITYPIDTTPYSTISLYCGKINSPLPGEQLQVGYVTEESTFEIIGTALTFVESDGVYNVDLTIPEEAKSLNTRFVFIVTRDGTPTPDIFAIQSFTLSGIYSKLIPLDFKYSKMNDDNYIIDGVEWVRVSGAWYRKIQTGFQYWDGTKVKEVPSNRLAKPVTIFEYEQDVNEKKREIFLLKPRYLRQFVDEFRKASLYQKSSDFVSNRLKKSGV